MLLSTNAVFAQTRGGRGGTLPPVFLRTPTSPIWLSWNQMMGIPETSSPVIGLTAPIPIGPFTSVIADNLPPYMWVSDCSAYQTPYMYCQGNLVAEAFTIDFTPPVAGTGTIEVEWSAQVNIATGVGDFQTGQQSMFFECYVDTVANSCSNTEDLPTILANTAPDDPYDEEGVWNGTIIDTSYHGYVTGLSKGTQHTLHIRLKSSTFITDSDYYALARVQTAILSY